MPRRPLSEMPALVRPQLPTLVARPPEGGGSLHEIKHDGYRTLVRLEKERRGELPGAATTGPRYGDLPAAFAKLRARQALIDGEILIQGEGGIADWNRLHAAAAAGERAPYVFFASDCCG